MNATVLSLFLAGASDVSTEHAVVRQAVDEWNAQHGGALSTYITVTSWKGSTYPEAGSEPQAVINRQVLDAADIVVGVFWTRFGTPTKLAGSGTEEEIERSIASGKKVLVYFSDRPIPPSSFNASEYERVAEFKKRYSERGLYSVISDIDQFRDDFRGHLARVVHELLVGRKEMPAQPATETISIALAPDYWIIILAALQPVLDTVLKRVGMMRTDGVKLDDVDGVTVTTLAGPIMTHAFIIDVLVKHGVIRPEAGERIGYDALMREVHQGPKNA